MSMISSEEYFSNTEIEGWNVHIKLLNDNNDWYGYAETSRWYVWANGKSFKSVLKKLKKEVSKITDLSG
jgi:hypothetical protein